MGAGQTVLIFAPEAALTAHFVGLCILARTLMLLGHKVKVVRCFNSMKRCMAMDAADFPYQASSLKGLSFCLGCLAQSLRIAAFYGIDAVSLDEFMSDDVIMRARQATAKLPKDIRTFEYDGVPFGKISMAGLALTSKATLDETVDSELRAKWVANIETAVLVYIAFGEIVEKIDVSRMIYFNDYPINMVVRVVAEKCKAPCFTISYASHKNVDRSRYVFFPIHTRGRYFHQRDVWPQWRDVALNGERISTLTDDIIHRVRGIGSHIYSPAKTLTDIRDALGIPYGKKIVAAYTSSLDEIVAGFTTSEAVGYRIQPPKQPFGENLEDFQMCWLRALVSYVEAREDVFLVVRIHPREGAVKGETAVSQRLGQLKAEFGGALANCRFIWPEDQVSSFDLGEVADLVLVSWSTIGVEMARLGVPVLSATYGISPFPNDEFLAFADTESEYFAKLEAMLALPPSNESMKLAYRWTNLFYHGNALDLSDVVDYAPSQTLPPYKFPLEAKAIDDIIQGRRDVLDINFERLLNSHGEFPDAEESAAISSQARRLVHFLSTGEDRHLGGLVCIRAQEMPDDKYLGAVTTLFDRSIGVIVTHGHTVRYLIDGRVYDRYSPMVSRLGEIGAKKFLAYP